MSDGVVFLDRKLRITVWNRRLESMTGLASKNLLNQRYETTLLGLKDPVSSNSVPEQNDPIKLMLKSCDVVQGDYRIAGNNGRELRVQLTVTPVIDAENQFLGCVLLMHDDSAQLNLQRQLKDLYAFSMLDPLTQVANRAEFERALDQFVDKRDRSNEKCSLIICDIDFFKQINDNYNHHIGDQTLIAFAALLKTFAKPNDVVARFGGEEFVILCDKCDLKSAAIRAEEMRKALNKTPMSMLNGKFITASFGVSELQANDSPTELFVRADTALIQAKEAGRNRVITSKTDQSIDLTAADSVKLLGGPTWPTLKGSPLISDEFRTRTPSSVLVEKLRGFIVEMNAELRTVEANQTAVMLVEFEDPANFSRKGRFEVRIDFMEGVEGEASEKHGRRTYTYMRITIRLAKRKWFSTNSPELAQNLLAEIRSYFMINDDSDTIAAIEPATEYRLRHEK